MSEQLQTALEGLWIVAVFLGLVAFVGIGATRLLLPDEWAGYRALLTPIVGWCILVLGLFVANLAVGVRIGIWPVLAAAAVANLAVLRRRRRPGDTPARGKAHPPLPLGGEGQGEGRPRGEGLPLLLGAGLVALALVPHAVQRSLGLLSLNGDEEFYFPPTAYVLSYPILGGPVDLSERLLEGIRLYGFAFEYSMAAASALSGSLPFQVYLPTTYCLLGLSVPAWFVFFREVYGLQPRAASIATLLYSLLGLPLWFASYGYGPQMGSLVAIPLGTAAFVAAVERGGARYLLLAGLAIAVGLASYYRGIGLHYVFTLLPVVAVATLRQRGVRPLARAVGVAAVALVLGLPSHWHVANWYFLHGAITDLEDITGNGDWATFQPIGVGLGTEASTWAHDAEGTGPLAFLHPALEPLAAPMAWLVLAVAAAGLVRSARKRPQPVAVLLGFVAYMALNRWPLNFPYGYFKLLAVLGPLVYGFVLLALPRLDGIGGAGRPARAAAAAFLLAVALFLGYNSYETLWYNAKGWGLSIPGSLATALHEMGQRVEPGSRVFVAGRFLYPVPPDRVQLRRDHRFALSRPDELRDTWSRRVRAMAMAELLHAEVYGRFDTQVIWRGYHRLLDDEGYDYYLLAPDNDPRVDGLDPTDRVWEGPGLALYESRGVVRRTPWTLVRERGSLAVLPDRPLSVWASGEGLRTDGRAAGASASPSRGRLRIGILALSRGEATVEMADLTRRLALEPGVTWYTTPTLPLPSTVAVRPAGGEKLGVVSLRLLGPGPEERDLVPESVIKDDIYASSSVLRLEHWLTDPFRGRGPGSI